jgi:hypothetical protein
MGIFWRRKIQLAALHKEVDEYLYFQRHTSFLVKLQCLTLKLLFVSYFFRRQPAEFFFSKQKIVK